jgi:hypothetical protein
MKYGRKNGTGCYGLCSPVDIKGNGIRRYHESVQGEIFTG